MNAAAARHEGSRIIVVNEPPVSFYLTLEHAVYFPWGGHRFGEVSREGGRVDLWSNQRLLSTEKDLRDYTATADEVWLIRAAERPEPFFSIAQVWKDRLLSYSREALSLDGRIEVVRIRLREPDRGSPAPLPDAAAAS